MRRTSHSERNTSGDMLVLGVKIIKIFLKVVILFTIFLSLPAWLREPIAWLNREIGIVIGWTIGSIAHIIALPFGWSDGTSQLFAVLRWYGGSSSITSSATDPTLMGQVRRLASTTAGVTIDPIGRTVIDLVVAFYITLPLGSWFVWRWIYLPLKNLGPRRPPSWLKCWWLWFVYGKPLQQRTSFPAAD